MCIMLMRDIVSDIYGFVLYLLYEYEIYFFFIRFAHDHKNLFFFDLKLIFIEHHLGDDDDDGEITIFFLLRTAADIFDLIYLYQIMFELWLFCAH